jgi:hypothetical protein
MLIATARKGQTTRGKLARAHHHRIVSKGLREDSLRAVNDLRVSIVKDARDVGLGTDS